MTAGPRPHRTQRRREIAWFLIAVCVVGALVFGARWWAGLLDHVDPFVACAIVIGVAGALFASRRRRGVGWNVARVLSGGAIVVVIAMATLVAVCIPSSCFN